MVVFIQPCFRESNNRILMLKRFWEHFKFIIMSRQAFNIKVKEQLMVSFCWVIFYSLFSLNYNHSLSFEYNDWPSRTAYLDPCQWVAFQSLGLLRKDRRVSLSTVLLSCTRMHSPTTKLSLIESWINHLPPACWSTFWKSNFKQQLGWTFDIVDNKSYFLCFDICNYICLIHQIIFRFYLPKSFLFFQVLLY